MKIAICDDETADALLIREYCTRFDPNLTTVVFTCGEALLKAYETDFFDLVFLDIEMEKINGLEVGNSLIGRKRKPIIVFTTQSPTYAIRGYGIAIRYLPKPISYEIFANTIKLALDYILTNKICITYEGVQRFLSVCDIVYFEVIAHQIIIHMKNGESITVRGTLSDFINNPSCKSFAQPHKSYFVNMQYVDRFTYQSVVMTTNAMIPIGRSKREYFQIRLHEYMKGINYHEYLD